LQYRQFPRNFRAVCRQQTILSAWYIVENRRNRLFFIIVNLLLTIPTPRSRPTRRVYGSLAAAGRDWVPDEVPMLSAAPALQLDAANAIDRDHLRYMTLGDGSLEQEVLRLFDRQAELLVGRMRGADPAALTALAHALKGSARGIGAFAVAAACERLERGEALEREIAMSALAAAVAQAREHIAILLEP
jgi:HPt (histidine-containing phosphotransfer) domain-containing protein